MTTVACAAGSRASYTVGNGLCQHCSYAVRARVVLSLKRRVKKVGITLDSGPIARYLNGDSKLKRSRNSDSKVQKSMCLVPDRGAPSSLGKMILGWVG